jgi:hypothetical protein
MHLENIDSRGTPIAGTSASAAATINPPLAPIPQAAAPTPEAAAAILAALAPEQRVRLFQFASSSLNIFKTKPFLKDTILALMAMTPEQLAGIPAQHLAGLMELVRPCRTSDDLSHHEI